MSDTSIDSILSENRVFPPSEEFTAAARLKPADVEALYKEAAQDHEAYWARLAREELLWDKPFEQVLDDSNAPNYRWFADGTLNVSANCLDANLAERADKTAIVFEGEGGDLRNLTYRELTDQVCQFSNALKAQGVGKGDRIVIYMPMVPEAVIAMQACARIGAIHSIVFGGFSATALRDRIEDAGAKMVITADGGHRGGRIVELKAATDEALSSGCETIETVIVLKRADCGVPMVDGRDVWWADAIDGQSTDCPA
ncbi:MAG: AMP-binding protein, partial [Gammaproteobacteria bacterium]